MSVHDRLVRTIRLTTSIDQKIILEGNTTIQEEVIKLSSQARKNLIDAGFQPFGDVTVYLEHDPMTLDKQTIVIEMQGTKDV